MNQEINKIIERIERLEHMILPKPTITRSPKGSGPKVGVLGFIENGFFDNKRSATETKTALEKEGYHYSRQVIQTALNRLSTSRGLLVSIIESGQKIYVKRK